MNSHWIPIGFPYTWNEESKPKTTTIVNKIAISFIIVKIGTSFAMKKLCQFCWCGCVHHCIEPGGKKKWKNKIDKKRIMVLKTCQSGIMNKYLVWFLESEKNKKKTLQNYENRVVLYFIFFLWTVAMVVMSSSQFIFTVYMVNALKPNSAARFFCLYEEKTYIFCNCGWCQLQCK